LREQLEPLAARSRIARVIQVHQQQIEFAARHRFQQIRGRSRRLGHVALPLQQQAQRTQHVSLIVGD